jgi:hypothetical protein
MHSMTPSAKDSVICSVQNRFHFFFRAGTTAATPRAMRLKPVADWCCLQMRGGGGGGGKTQRV